MEKSLKIHKNLIDNKKHRSARFTELIADFSDGYAKNWWFCVPSFFCEALDIRSTERVVNNKRVNKLTQGSNYNFTTGDTFYNHAYPYCNEFHCVNQSELPNICIQIQSATPCIQASENNLRNPGIVNFNILINQGKSQSECIWKTIGFKTLTQDEFIELLIKGIPPEWINEKDEMRVMTKNQPNLF